MKPNWKDAPEWAQWLALDEDNRWVWAEIKPEVIGNENSLLFWKGKIKIAKSHITKELLESSIESRPQ